LLGREGMINKFCFIWPNSAFGFYWNRLHIYPLCRHSGSTNLGFTSHSKDEAIEVRWLAQGHKRGGPWRVSNTRRSDLFGSLDHAAPLPKTSSRFSRIQTTTLGDNDFKQHANLDRFAKLYLFMDCFLSCIWNINEETDAYLVPKWSQHSKTRTFPSN
jgi:hypothetical protein